MAELEHVHWLHLPGCCDLQKCECCQVVSKFVHTLTLLRGFQHQQHNLIHEDMAEWNVISFLRTVCVSAWGCVKYAFGTCLDSSLLPYHGCMVHLLKQTCFICQRHSRLFPEPRMCTCSCLDIMVLFITCTHFCYNLIHSQLKEGCGFLIRYCVYIYMLHIIFGNLSFSFMCLFPSLVL